MRGFNGDGRSGKQFILSYLKCVSAKHTHNSHAIKSSPAITINDNKQRSRFAHNNDAHSFDMGVCAYARVHATISACIPFQYYCKNVTIIFDWQDMCDVVVCLYLYARPYNFKKVMTLTNRKTNRSKATLIYILAHGWFSHTWNQSHMWHVWVGEQLSVLCPVCLCLRAWLAHFYAIGRATVYSLGVCFTHSFDLTLCQMHEFVCVFVLRLLPLPLVLVLLAIVVAEARSAGTGTKCNCFYFD